MLLIFGSINVDLVFPLSHLPEAGDTLWSGRSRLGPGGKGANQATAAVRDGRTVTLAGAVGDDVLAEVALHGLEEAGVDIRHVRRVAGSTGRAAVNLDPKGYTTVSVDAGANLQARAAQVPDSLLRRRTTVLAQLETEPAEVAALIVRARSRGCRVILHLSPARPIATEALRAADILLGNKHEIAWTGRHLGTGNNPASLADALGNTVLRLQGEQGVEAMSEAGYMWMPALPSRMRDRTAAADCFTGVFAGAIDAGDPLDRALRRGAVAAALGITGIGAQGSMPDRAAIDNALRGAPQVTTRQPEITD